MIKKLLIIGFVWPEPKSSAAGSRMIQLIHEFQAQKFEVIFASAAKKSKNTFHLPSISVQIKTIELNNTSFNRFVEELNPDIVLFDRFMTEEQFGWRVAETCPNAIRILDMEDFHGLRKGRERAVKENRLPVIQDFQNQVTKREIASIYRCDLSLVISEVEMQYLSQDFGISQELLLYVPFLIEPLTSKEKLSAPDYHPREHFMTIGNFLHAPNYDATLYLKTTIWPKIKCELPNAELHVYGAYDSQKVTQLNNPKEGFFIKGFAHDALETMQNYKLCLVPLRFGAGLKGKILDAMMTGTPCIMSSIAAEGMFGQMKANGYVADIPDEFAKSAINLYKDSDIWSQMQENGFQVLEKHFNRNSFKHSIADKVESLRIDLIKHRQTNFIGQILQFQSLQSTKYMSKWIEEKNKSN